MMQGIPDKHAVLIGPMGRIPLETGRFTIGRAPDNQLVVSNDPKVSAHHAEIRAEGQNYAIVDLGSTNHTFVNEQELYQNPPRLLRHGDIIRIGDSRYTFSYEAKNAVQGQPLVSDGSTMRADAGAVGAVGGPGPVAGSEQFGTYYGGGLSDADETYLKPQASFGPPAERQGFAPPTFYAVPPQGQQQPPSFHQTMYAQAQPAQGTGTATGGGMMQQPPPGAPFIPNVPTNFAPPPKRRKPSMVLIGLVLVALLVIIASASFLFVAHNNQVAMDASATATAASVQTQVVRGTATAHAQATAVVVHATETFVAQFPNPYPPHTGTLVFYDTLADASTVPINKWDENSNCQFSNGGYHATESQQKTFFVCGAHATNFANFAYRIEMTIVSGDCGGIVFRSDNQNRNLYLYEVCSDGTYALATYNGTSGQYLISHQANAAINKGTGQMNLIAVVANGSTLNLYANNVLVGSQNDTKFSVGQIGVYADNYTSSLTDVQFDNARVWKL